MKRIAFLVVAVSLFAMVGGGIVFADPINIGDELGDLLTGHKDNVEFWPYVAYTTKKPVYIKGIPVIPKHFRTKVSSHLGRCDREYKLEMGVEF